MRDRTRTYMLYILCAILLFIFIYIQTPCDVSHERPLNYRLMWKSTNFILIVWCCVVSSSWCHHLQPYWNVCVLYSDESSIFVKFNPQLLDSYDCYLSHSNFRWKTIRLLRTRSIRTGESNGTMYEKWNKNSCLIVSPGDVINLIRSI